MLRGALAAQRATQAIEDLASLPLARVPHRALVSRVWQLRGNVAPYDASYVAVAERLGVTLLTADARLAKASGLMCAVEVRS